MTDTRIGAPSNTMPRRQPLLARVPAAFVRAVLKGHSSLGLAFAAAIYLVCLTGTLAVFAREFQRWENPHAPVVAVASPDAVQAALEGAIRTTGSAVEHAYVFANRPDLPWLTVSVETGGTFREWIADASGRIIGETRTPWTAFMMELHTRFHLPHTWGRFLVGLVGVALLSSLISGILAHPRIFRDAFHLRLGGSRRLQEADLHNRMGIWALPFHIVVSATGAFLGLTTLVVGVLGFALFQGDVGKVYGLFFPPEPKDNPAPAPVIDLRPMFAQVGQMAPGGRISFIGLEHPTEQGAAAMFNVDAAERGLFNGATYAFTRDGALYHQSRLKDATIGQQVVAATGSLHFGWFGGAPVKIAYGLLGFAMTYLAASGVTIWLARRRDKGRPAPRWERLWSACVWGQPAALVAAAVGAMLVPAADPAAMLTIWGAVTVLTLAAALAAGSTERVARAGRLGTGGLLLLLAALHLTQRQGAGGDPVGWVVEGILVVGALLMLGVVRPRRQAA